MSAKITCFIPFGTKEETEITVGELRKSSMVSKVYILGDTIGRQINGAEILGKASLTAGKTIQQIAEKSDTPYIFIYTKTSALTLGQLAMERFYQVAEDTQSGLVYANYRAIKGGAVENLPVIDYQEGSLRDDFNFGSVLFCNAKLVKDAVKDVAINYEHAGLYALRLALAALSEFMRIPEVLYTEEELDTRKSGEKIFDYVDPKNRAVQIEMEQACTEHLKRIGAFLEPKFADVAFNEGNFKVEASVIIPVRDRAKTIADAIKSVLAQKAKVDFNLIIVDNYSTDGTTEIIEKYAKLDNRIIHIIPERKDLGIGGCWNEAVNHPACGKFAIQLDSDDLYADETTVQRVVDAFYQQNCAMVVGTYQMVNFALEEIPPGVIDHKEWTPENGRNNALRINGLGAPRAFYTPVLRKNPIPNVNYGEDYALGLAISRKYQIGRIYDPIYLCRRWDENSDASLSVEKMNAHNTYKDRIRTIELKARKLLTQK
ncbi:glycosyltransferase family 2 protein [Ancylomarina longa]|uniref:Glycosyltransferase family 2 protein n=1 Tax=Ancylomarina longa TaxID=2487017 RepID=A0A434AFD6_9BACT|nr:glycosyltransferase family A protein [Ancylomarina longa]RUT73097.1 glycosyltransferase family 2 protein [Ancylomarina longa]